MSGCRKRKWTYGNNGKSETVVPTSLQRPFYVSDQSVALTMRSGLCVYNADAWCSLKLIECFPDFRLLMWPYNNYILIAAFYTHFHADPEALCVYVYLCINRKHVCNFCKEVEHPFYKRAVQWWINFLVSWFGPLKWECSTVFGPMPIHPLPLPLIPTPTAWNCEWFGMIWGVPWLKATHACKASFILQVHRSHRSEVVIH